MSRQLAFSYALTGQTPEFSGHRKGQQKVLGGHLFAQLALQPLLAFVMLAVRAVAMTAGVRHQPLVFAGAALDLHLGAVLGATVFDGAKRVSVFSAQPIAVLREEIGLEGFDDGGQADHLTCPQATE